MNYQVLARKWRPRSLKEIVGQEHILRILTHALTQQGLHHAYLFTGIQGVGKTTFGRILAKCVNCESGITAESCGTCKNCTAIDTGRFLDLLEIDAASRTKVEDTREVLDNIQYQPTQGRYKVYLIDEVHMLSTHSFNALLKTLEEPPPYVIFLLATTDPKRLPATILSRCLQLNLKRIPTEQITQHLQHICTVEKITFEIQALSHLARAADGSLRDALSLLDQANALCHGNITITEIQQMLGSIEQDMLYRLLQALAKQDGKQLLSDIAKLAEFAIDFNQILEDLLSLLHQISIAQVVDNTVNSNTPISQFAKDFTAEDIQLYYQIALIGRRDLPLAPNPQFGFEMVMLRMLAFKPAIEKARQKKVTNLQATPPNTFLPTEKATPEVSQVRAWADILAKLELTGMAQALAANCTLLELKDTQIVLSLSKQHEAMFNNKLLTRIEEALAKFFNKPMKLDIQLTSTEINTPSKLQHQKQAALQATAVEAIKNDSEIHKMMTLFEAKLDIDSIEAV
ncbi:MAG: dnaX [Gammaproteobacteria bacterium]|jgi:DNA polymerase-3 subunit gamma/tau|nr:dnaX [Gammaproteobacteria bacterium]